ncbi:unnamed protein product [Oikopleura dioica]|uniref:ribonuclease H n=1 Tax=Oikopleura dioica TaxID=34765 RepID=E4XA02_OIKDI|nr:unnamed protein product [Oikopleura dioica]
MKHIISWEHRNIRSVANTKLGVFDKRNRNKIASFHIYINGKPIWIDSAIVINNYNGILLGTPDLGAATIINMVDETINFVKIGEIIEYGDAQRVAIATDHPLHKSRFELDSRKIYKQRISEMRNEAKNSTTVSDIVYGENIAEATRKKLKKVLESKEYEPVFRKAIGCLNKSFDIQATMEVEVKEENIGPRRKSENLSEEKKQIIAKNLDELYRDGVLVFPDEHGVKVKNIIPLMVCGKTDDNGVAIPLSQSARIVTQAHTTVNRWSKTPPMVTDDLNDVLRQAAKASKYDYSLKCDISNAFFQLPMDKSLWSWFGVYHPYQGPMVYTRCTQGWVASMGYMRAAFLRVFSPLSSYLLRYADDVHLVAKTEDEFIEVVARFLDICKHHGLTLKGSKMHIMPERMNFLGAVIKNGRITASPHQAAKIRNYSKEKISTVSELRSFLGLLVPLSKFQSRPTDFLVPLRKLLDGDGKTKIDWTEEADKALSLAKNSMDKLVELTPFDAKKRAYIVVDSSADGCGAILFQKDDSTDPPVNRVCEFYSRKRPDAERKFKASSCMLETSGAVGCLCYWRRYFIEAGEPVVLYTDSRPFSCIAKKWAENCVPSDIVEINNLFKNISGLKVVVVHLPGKSIEISGVDFISRSKEHMEDCNEDCQICKLASTPKVDEVPFISEEQMEKLSAELAKYKKAAAVRRIQIHNFDETMYEKVWNMNDSWTDEIDHEIEAFETVSAVLTPRKARKLNDFINDGLAIRQIQQSDKTLKSAIHYIEKKLNPPPRQQKLATLCRKAYVKNQHLKTKKWIGTQEFELILMPEKVALKIMRIIHDSTLCQSPSQLAEKARRYFEMPNIKIWAAKFTTSCYKCTLLKKPDAYRPQPLKAVGIPSRIGELILVDEINRTDRNKQPFKVFFATEGLTRMGIALPVRDTINSDNFVNFMYLCRQLLAPLRADKAEVIIRTDGHTAHLSSETKERLDEIGMKIEVYESSSMSKNIIPEQDGRIAVLSKFLNAALNDRESSVPKAVSVAISQYNHVLGNKKSAPVELFTGRKICTQEPISVNINDLVTEIETDRTTKRELADRRNAEKKMRAPRLILKPAGEAVDGPNEQTLQENDVVRLNEKWDKADLDRLWKVVDINWQEGKFRAKKYNIRNEVKPKTFDISLIDSVISHTVAEIRTSLIRNPAARQWFMRGEDVSIWEESEWNLQGPRVHRVDLLDDSAISLGPKSTLPPTPMPEMDPNPDRATSTPSKSGVLNSTFNAWNPMKYAQNFMSGTANWIGSPETPDLNSSNENTIIAEGSDESFHSVASSALNDNDIAELEKPEPRRSNRTRKQVEHYQA